MNTSGNKVVKNAAWIIGAKIVQSVLTLIISMLTARYLGPSNYGLISYAASIVAFVVPIMQLGLSGILVQEIIVSPESEGTVVGTSIIMSFISSIACMIGVVGFCLIANPGETETTIVCFLYSFLLPAQAIEMCQYWYQAKLASKYTSVVSLIAYTLVSTYKIFLLITQKNIYWFAISNALDYAIIGILLIIIYKKKSSNNLSFSRKIAIHLFKKSRYYIISNMMVTIFAQTDRIMLKLMVSDKATGMYSAAVNCACITSFVFLAILDSMRPLILSDKSSNELLYKKNISRLYSIIIYLSLAQSIVMSVFSSLIVHILYGNAYESTGSILKILVWYTTFSYMGSVRNIWILAENKQKYLWIINLSGALANIVLNAILIPIYSGVGAAIASLITQIFTNVVIGYIIRPISGNNILMLKGLNPKILIQMIRKKEQ